MSELCARSELVSRLEAKLTAGRQDGQGVVSLKVEMAILHRPSKGISIDKQADDDVVHLRRFRKADRLPHQAFDAGA